MDEELGYLQKGEVCEGEAVSLYSIRISHLTSNFTCDFLWLFLIREVPWNPDSTWTNGRDGRWTQNFFYSCPPSPNRKAWDHITLGWLIHLLLMIWAQKGWPPNISRKKTDWLVCLGGDWRVLSSNELPKASLLCSLALISFLYSFLRGYCCNTFPSKTSIVSLFSPRKFFGVSLLFKRSSSTFSPHWNSAMLHLGKNGNLKQNSHHAFFFFSYGFSHLNICIFLFCFIRHRSCCFSIEALTAPDIFACQISQSRWSLQGSCAKCWVSGSAWSFPPSWGSQMTSQQTSFPPLRVHWSRGSRVWFQGLQRPVAVGSSS